MTSPATLTEFLEFAGFEPRFFDMGRRITKISKSLLFEIEMTLRPYPYPLQRQAWFAILLQEKTARQNPAVWFLRFPLDEQGKLLQAARDDFMQQLMEQTAKNLSALEQGERFSSAMEHNRYSFKPNQERRAVFHAKASSLLKRPASEHYTAALAYFRGELGWEQWPRLPLQGIADLAVRAGEPEGHKVIVAAIPHLPDQPYSALCHALENEEISPEIALALSTRAEKIMEETPPDTAMIASTLRGISNSRSGNLKRALITKVLKHPASEDVEILAAIGGRAWESLADTGIRRLFLERLAVNSGGEEQFNYCMTDLLFMPGLRRPLLDSMRDPSRSEQLGRALGALFQSLEGG